MSQKDLVLKKVRLIRTKSFPYLLLLPALILFSLFVFYPFLRSVYLSFFVTNNLGVPLTFVGLKNFERVFSSSGFLNSVIATLKFAAMVAVGTFTLAMILALLSMRMVKGGKIYQTMYSLPMTVASVPISAIALFVMSRYGILNSLLGISVDWFASKNTALLAAALVTIWTLVGMSTIFLVVGFRNVPEELIDSATIDGANSVRKIVNVIIPIASPQIFFVIFINILNSFKAFAIINLLTGRGPGDSTNILIYAIYSNAFIRGRFETACVYSLVLCLFIFTFTRIQMMFEKRMVHYK